MDSLQVYNLMFPLSYKDIAYHTSEWLSMTPLTWPKVQLSCSFEHRECKEEFFFFFFEKSVEISTLSTIPKTKCLQNLIRSAPPKEAAKHLQLWFVYILLLYSFPSSLIVLQTSLLLILWMKCSSIHFFFTV